MLNTSRPKVAIDATFTIAKDILHKIEIDETAFTQYAKRLVAIDLYKNKGISLGYCAEVAEMTKEAFMFYLSENKISVFNFKDADEFLEDARNA